MRPSAIRDRLATLFGFLRFGDFPDLTTWFGISVVVASGLTLVWADRAAAEDLPPDPV